MNHTFELPEANFSKSFRGFSVTEVEEFFQNSLEVMSQANEFISELTDKIRALEKEVKRLQEAEMALFKALNSAEDAKEEMKEKLKVEREKVITEANKEAQKIVLTAKEEIEKLKLIADQENLQQKEALAQDLIEQERSLNQLKGAQSLIAKQLAEIASATLEKIESWKEVESEKIQVKSANKPDGLEIQIASNKTAGKSGKKVGSKVSKVSKKDVESENVKGKSDGDVGLPTLGKVLEAYAKSNAPKGNIADIS